jgi:hypothetical protein
LVISIFKIFSGLLQRSQRKIYNFVIQPSSGNLCWKNNELKHFLYLDANIQSKPVNKQSLLPGYSKKKAGKNPAFNETQN